MKYINKSQEPGSLTVWNRKQGKKISNWKSFNKSVKEDVYQSLLREQGYICCYCGINISRRNCHVEHFRPKSKYQDLTFTYTNLIASCQGEDEVRPTKPVHCGHKKTNWFDDDLMISPLNPQCVNYFRYSGSGDILPTNDVEMQIAAKTTIDILALNIDKLRKMRRVAVDAVLEMIEGLSDAEVKLLAEGYQRVDDSGKYTPFSMVVSYFLNQF
ncbi:retron system putative HNH endonuclease [Brunnivagina elsteri]|uniref:TIGR02646 family protein n=1 Tax=Brunnivagina elsteri CCALA 953 TaxID=987040 RepID=A0A2A2TFE7_9CYAN|nr:retron system putative HNH endonuclease [Calothrix elsteri]PAX52396.1 TIGR02646 family protein [Calothrix elsteri CCALA 953]